MTKCEYALINMNILLIIQFRKTLISDKNVNCVYYSVVQRERKIERTREIARFVTGYFLV